MTNARRFGCVLGLFLFHPSIHLRIVDTAKGDCPLGVSTVLGPRQLREPTVTWIEVVGLRLSLACSK